MEISGIRAENGLGTALFNFSTTLVPAVNVDLLIWDNRKGILLSWRDDYASGKGWHVPGGCIRFRKTFEERIKKTAQEEIGTEVIHEKDPVQVFEIHSDMHKKGLIDQNKRAHFISLAYLCRLPDNFSISFQKKGENEAGYLKWFTELPDDLIKVHSCYKEKWPQLIEKIKESKIYGKMEQ